MGKTISFLLKVVFILLLLVPVSSKIALAHHQAQVLGESTDVQVSIPPISPTAEGPGFILPDSPLFFIDNIKQNIRLFIAFTPESKARVHAAVAGERLAELRLMLLKKHNKGIEKALNGVSENFAKASDRITDAQLTGRDISELARKLNLEIKEKQKTLDELEVKADIELKPRVKAAAQALLKAKVRVEDSLPSHELEVEIRDDINRLMIKRVNEASESAREIEDEIEELQRQATESSQKSLIKREESLRRAIERKNEALKKAEEKILEKEKKRQKKILELQEKATEQARESVRKAQEAAVKVNQLHKAIEEMRKEDSGSSDVSNSTLSSGSSSSNSGSGSSSSGKSGKSESSDDDNDEDED